MKTLTDLLAEDAAEIKCDIARLMEHSKLHQRRDCDTIVHIDPNGNSLWGELPLEVRPLQSKILEDYRRYHEMIRTLTRGIAKGSQREFAQAHALVVKHVEQQIATWSKSVADAQTETLGAIDEMQGLLDHLYSPQGEVLIVPDTNALILGAPLEQWSFDWCDAFTLVLTPTVLAELDELKIAHRNPEVRTKAERIIRQIKEYGRRGNLRSGVPIVTGRIKARSIAVEPKLDESLSWLDPTNNDDRLLASTIEIIRQNVRSVVVLVTADINLQNKSTHARLPAVEPPEVRGDLISNRATKSELEVPRG